MASLKALRSRINAVRNTRKITSAMKMVAASKLRRAQEAAESARPYADRLDRMLRRLTALQGDSDAAPALMAGTGQDQNHLLVVMTADRGLCGAFNANILRATRRRIRELEESGKTVRLLLVGRKGAESLRRDHGDKIVRSVTGIGAQQRTVPYSDARIVGGDLLDRFDNGEVDVASVIYNKFRSAISQVVTIEQLIPFEDTAEDEGAAADGDSGPQPLYEFEPDEESILADLLPRNVNVQIYKALLESAASEQGARMSAMDNATRNADEMIDKLTMTYNRTRQAVITKELMEIISGAEAQ